MIFLYPSKKLQFSAQKSDAKVITFAFHLFHYVSYIFFSPFCSLTRFLSTHVKKSQTLWVVDFRINARQKSNFKYHPNVIPRFNMATAACAEKMNIKKSFQASNFVPNSTIKCLTSAYIRSDDVMMLFNGSLLLADAISFTSHTKPSPLAPRSSDRTLNIN